MVNGKFAIIGLQTGDEGKGVRTVYLTRKAVERSSPSSTTNQPVLTIRYQGGGNAGHTVETHGNQYKFHEVNSAVLVPGAFNLMGERTFVNPRAIMSEIQGHQGRGVPISPKNFGIASNAHVTLNFHTIEDQKDREKTEHTSTGKGIKPTAVDKYGRIGLRLEEFLDRNISLQVLKEKRFPNGLPDELQKKLEFKSVEELVDSYGRERAFLSHFSVLQTKVLRNHGTHYWVAEGAQGFRLDVDKGLYPGVTSSNPTIVPFQTDLILGVVKLYESSVGRERPFVSRMDRETETVLRETFGEHGTTTGLPRNLGWFDTVAVKHAIESTDTDYLIGSCGDRLEALSNMGVKPKIVLAYEIDGKVHTEWDKSFHNRRTLYGAKPIFEEMEPWDRFVDDNKELTPNAQRYVDIIQARLGREFIWLGTGPGEEDVVEIKDPLSLISSSASQP